MITGGDVRRKRNIPNEQIRAIVLSFYWDAIDEGFLEPVDKGDFEDFKDFISCWVEDYFEENMLSDEDYVN